MVASPLTQLTRKDTPWRGGQLPPDALTAFKELKQILCSQPLVAYPRPDRPFALIVDAAAGVTKINSKGQRTFRQEGGLGAILCQPDHKGELHVIAYASRALAQHEKNYTPFLLEMLACCWGIDHFDVYLKGRKFVIYSDHRPLEKLSCVHEKTLNRLTHKMNEYDFIIQYKKGAEMPADFLSRNVLEEIQIFTPDLPLLQQRDEFAAAVVKFLQVKQLPANKHQAAYIARIAPSCFLEDGILWRRIARHGAPARTVLVVPAAHVDQLIHETHGALMAGHEGITKTKERLLQSYFWPNMDKDIARHIQACQRCQARRRDVRPTPNVLTPLAQCTELNQRVHMDLFGPLKVSNQGKKFVLCLTDAFTKYAVMVAIDNKEASTVANAIFEQWICKFGTPLEFVSDNGREFCNNLAKELYALLRIKHSTTTPYWPQCNSQAEVANKTIQKYLASFVDATTLDWPIYMAPMAFAYNTSVHRSIKTTPFFLTHGVDARYPSFPNPDVQRYYGESKAAEWYNTLQHCRQIAAQHNMDATGQAEQQYNKTAQVHNFHQGQMVWLNETNYLGRNRKLSPTWTGPHLVLQVFPNGVVELLIKNRRVKVNVGRIKPATPSLPQAQEQQQQPERQQPQQAPQQQQQQQPDNGANAPQPFNNDENPLRPAAILPQVIHTPQDQQQQQHPPAPEQVAPQPPKRGRGRPRKVTIDPPAQQQQDQQPPPAAPAPQTDTQEQPTGPITRARARALERQALSGTDAIRLIRQVNNEAKRALKFKPIPHYNAVEGPDFVADEYGLPKQFKGQKQPASIIRRRKFLKSLSPTQRNLLLTGDPVFAFDPIAYEVFLTCREVPPIIQQQFDYLQPAAAGASSTATSTTASSTSSTPVTPSSPQPPQPTATPRAPQKTYPVDEDRAPAKGVTWAADAGASPTLAFDVTSPGAGDRWMRSSTSPTPAYLVTSPTTTSWEKFKSATKAVAEDLLFVPPPGWKAPKPPGYVKPPPSMLKRAARALKEEIMYPPIPFEGRPLPPRIAAKRAAEQQAAHAATGARPKTHR